MCSLVPFLQKHSQTVSCLLSSFSASRDVQKFHGYEDMFFPSFSAREPKGYNNMVVCFVSPKIQRAMHHGFFSLSALEDIFNSSPDDCSWCLLLSASSALWNHRNHSKRPTILFSALSRLGNRGSTFQCAPFLQQKEDDAQSWLLPPFVSYSLEGKFSIQNPLDRYVCLSLPCWLFQVIGIEMQNQTCSSSRFLD